MSNFIENLYKKFNLRRKIQVINRSGLFDNNFYLRLYPDTKEFTGGGITHYITHGEKEGRQPNLFFSPHWYASVHTISSDESPLLHYIERGESKGFQPCPCFDPIWYHKNYMTDGCKPLKHFLDIGLPKKLLPNKNYISDTDDNRHGNIAATTKIAVVIHVYYLEMLPSILSRITTVPLKSDLFFTVPPTIEGSLVKSLNSFGIKNYEIITYTSGGYDIAPFILLLSHLQDKNYDLLCKIHTKKGDGELGEFWFQLLIDSIFGSEHTVKEIISKFESDKDLGLVGGIEVYKSAQKLMYGNTPFIENILSTTSINHDLNKDWGFFAGTMFWAKLDMFKPLIDNKRLHYLIHLESHNEKTGASASIFHAIERFFGLLPQLTNMKIAFSHPTNLKKSRHIIKTHSRDNLPISSVAISMTLQSELKMLNTLKCYYKAENNKEDR